MYDTQTYWYGLFLAVSGMQADTYPISQGITDMENWIDFGFPD